VIYAAINKLVLWQDMIGVVTKFATAGLVWLVPRLTTESYTPAFIIGAALAILAVVMSVF